MMRKMIHITSLGLFCFLLIPGCDYYENYETRYSGNVEGTIYNRGTGQTLEGVTVYYDYKLEEGQAIDDKAYYELDYEGSTESDSQGKFLIRNLAENRKYVIVMRKWPGFEQKGTFIKPIPLQTDRLDFHLDSAVSEVRFEPETLHFDKATNQHALSVINLRSTPFNWTIDQDVSWIHCEPTSGTIDSNGAQAILISFFRDFMNVTDTVSSVKFTVLSTGEEHVIPVSAER